MPLPQFLGGVVKAADVARLLERQPPPGAGSRPLREDRSNVKAGDLPRIAFAGRSNVGKSSLLNALTNSKCARVSAEPGKTREMNFFRYGLTRDPRDQLLLVDLPGYGFAKVAGKLRDEWGREITAWLRSDERIALVVALVDGRHGYLAKDVELVEFLKTEGLPFLVAFTKMDKYKSANQRRSAERDLKEVSGRLGVERFICVSALSRDGVRPLETALKEALR